MPCLTKSGKGLRRVSVLRQNSLRAPSLETRLTRSRTMKQHINSCELLFQEARLLSTCTNGVFTSFCQPVVLLSRYIWQKQPESVLTLIRSLGMDKCHTLQMQTNANLYWICLQHMLCLHAFLSERLAMMWVQTLPESCRQLEKCHTPSLIYTLICNFIHNCSS